MTPRRICLLANLAATHSVRWANHFCRKGYEVHVLSVGDGFGLLPRVHVHPLRDRLPFKLDYFREVGRMRELVANVRPALVHAHYASGYGTLGRMIGFHPYILSVWGSDIYEFPNLSPLHKCLLKWNLAAADYLCSTSRDMARETGKYTSKPVLITSFGVDCEVFQPRRAPNVEGREFVVGTVKSMEECYGIDGLIRAFKLLADRHREVPCKLVIVGGGALEDEYRRLAQSLGLGSRVHFTGRVTHDLVPDYLRSLSVFVALSRWESFGVAVLEASACGIPVVATRVGGLPEVVVDGETGILVPPGDDSAAAGALETLLLSPNLQERMGRAGRAWVEQRYQWDVTARVMEDIYERAVSGWRDCGNLLDGKLMSARG